MRIASIAAASLLFVFTSEDVVRSQEPDKRPRHDQSLISDVEASNKKAAAGHDNPDAGAGAPSNSKLPATLGEALAQALRSNPDVLLAEAKLRQAEAEHNQSKLKVVQDVTVAFQQWHNIRSKLERSGKMNEKGYIGVLGMAALTFEQTESEAKLAYLLGSGAEPHSARGEGNVVVKPIVTYKMERVAGIAKENKEPAAKKVAAGQDAAEKRLAIPEKYRKVLQKPMKVKFAGMNLDQVIVQLNMANREELPIMRSMETLSQGPLDVELSGEVSLQNVLEMLADMTGCVFVFRDYGLLVTSQATAINRYPRAATIPDNARGVADSLRAY